MDLIQQLSRELHLRQPQVEAAVRLLDEGNTIPFIARYRKEMTDSLDDAALRDLSDRLEYLRGLQKRREEVIRSITEQEKLTPELEAAILAAKTLAELTEMGYGDLPVCIAKTQYSFSDNAKLLAAPEGFAMEVREVRLSAGAGFVVVICGSIMTMPGLPKKPAAVNIDVDADGRISGLF